MTYLLDTGLPTATAPWFANFINMCADESQSKVNLEDSFRSNLAKYNGRGTKSAFIEFDTPEDAVAFVLKWS
jgi:hypothetical protein